MDADTDGLLSEVALADDREVDLVQPPGGGRGPAVLFLHWFDSEAPDGNRTQFRGEAVQLARDQGVVSILPQGRFPWTAAPTGAGADAALIEREVAAHGLALDLLAGRSDVDPARIAVVGHDFGAMHGVLLAARDPRVSALVAIAATPRWADWFLPFWPIEDDRFEYLRALHPLDPITSIGELAPRPILLQFARGDFYIAEMTARELHRAAADPRELRLYDADHAMRSPDARRDRLEFLGRSLGWGAS